MSKIKYICPNCENANVFSPAWIGINDPSEVVWQEDHSYCMDCDHHIERCEPVDVQLRFTNYDPAEDGDLLIVGFKDGREYDFLPSEVMPMVSAHIDDKDGYWTVISDKLGRITFQSIDIEEDK